ncbi:immunoglobulin kappa light chain-like [Eretmochelys imbricata]
MVITCLHCSTKKILSDSFIKMIFAKYLILSSLVLGVQLFLYQTQRIQSVEVSDTAKIHCSSTENLEGGSSILWYLRREGETPTCIKSCLDDQNVSKFACKHETHSSTLEISNVQKTETGIYYCAVRITSYLLFGNGTTLIVGDSFTNTSWVMLLVPFPHGSQVTGTANLACVIHGVSSPVHVSWSVSGELQEQGLTHSLKAKDGSLTLINHISVPMDTWTSGKNFTCEIKFNSSDNIVKKSTRYPAAHASSCLPSIVSLAVLSTLMLLMVSLSLIWTLCPSRLGFQPRSSAPPASQENQGGILYAHLDFDSRNRDGRTMQPSARGKHVKP